MLRTYNEKTMSYKIFNLLQLLILLRAYVTSVNYILG